MIDLPLQSISISDFRRLSGHRTLPLDAPIVLVHGPNGTGKTSILAALEMGLTGQIRSMQRQDRRYTAYLPHTGQDFATIRVETAERYSSNREAGPLTVGGSRIQGRAAFSEANGAFFSERCYLDQVSLGQLLELYQYTEGREESALARFVNELLGLEQLDALREGLSSATDFRRLKNLSQLLDDGGKAADRSAEALTAQTIILQGANGQLTDAKAQLLAALGDLGLQPPSDDAEALVELTSGTLSFGHLEAERTSASNVLQEVVGLGGRVAAVSDRRSTVQLDAARIAMQQAEREFLTWQTEAGPKISSVQQAALAMDFGTDDASLRDIEGEIGAAAAILDRQASIVSDELPAAQARYATSTSYLDELVAAFALEQEHAGTLVEGLAAIRAVLAEDSDVCPVCDRDYSEFSPVHLSAHIDQRLAELTGQGERLMSLRARRESALLQQSRHEVALSQLRVELLPPERRQQLEDRRRLLESLRNRLVEIQPSVRTGRNLKIRYEESQEVVHRFEEAASEVAFITGELSRLAEVLEVTINPADTIEDSSKKLSAAAADRMSEVEKRVRLIGATSAALAQFLEARRGLHEITQSVAEAARTKQFWDGRISEARRRQAIARSVHSAAATARTEVVQHVFTESLNQLWRAVFSRLAPREQYIPSFGVPNTTKTALELTLQTTHISGEAGGSPQMMLSAGNLNTAALSLFLALHLSVEPIVPCLVFDDPVQAMDEVHISQFAGLIRVLSKHHGRQVVIAVHERELFEYLSLELSPAYEGDELLTIELGDRATSQGERVTRHTWQDDFAIA